MKILIITDSHIYAIGKLFATAIKQLEHEVICFDLNNGIDQYIKLGKAGKIIHNFLPLEAWTKKGNRDLAIVIKNFRPDQIIISGHVQLMYGTMAFAKSILPKTKITLYWPDPLINLTQNELNLAEIADKLVSYSRKCLPVFEQMGFIKVEWMPFAGDIEFLGTGYSTPDHFKYDLTFIGGWRPEREKVIETIISNMPHLNLKVFGTDWKKNSKNKGLRSVLVDKPIYGHGYGDLIRQSRINLNIIDETNYPAANMRFFEIPTAGGLQLSSSCPEQEDIFIHGKHVYYFEDSIIMCEMIQFIISNEKQASEVRSNGTELARREHTYMQRIGILIS